MKKKKYEIVEGVNGYWIAEDVGEDGFVELEGWYSTLEEAKNDVPQDGSLQYPLLFNKK